MAEFTFKLPDVGEGTAEAEIVAWHVAVGDAIEEDAPLVDVMTDKATVEMTSPVSGKIVSLHGELGEMAAVGAPLAVIATDAEVPVAKTTAKLATAMPAAPKPAAAPAPQMTAPPTPTPIAAARPTAADAKPLASPAVRRLAFERGVALQFVPGSGPGGRILRQDVDGFGRTPTAAAPGRPSAARREGSISVKVIGLRRRIAEKMQESKRRIPHFAYVEEVDVSELEALRVYLNGQTQEPPRPRLTLLPFLIAAICRALPDFPQINATFDDEAGVVSRHGPVHMGMATQTPNGLIVPVIRHAEARGVFELAAEIGRLATATREGAIAADELRGSTITITSLGALGGVVTTPVINHPEVAIVAPNRIVERPVVVSGQIAVRKMMNLSSSFDHRVVDGYDAARFIHVIKGLLEHPASIFMDGP